MKNYCPSQGADDEFIDQQNAELYDALKAELKANSANRWHWDEIDFSWTGKDADLEIWGHQGLHLDSIDDREVVATVHCGKTIPGTDVCLNTPDNPDEKQLDKALSYYLDQVTEIVCGCNIDLVQGEWDGDAWYMTGTFQVRAATILDPETGKLNALDTYLAIYKAAEEAVKPWDEEMTSLDQYIDAIAGWKNAAGVKMREGQIPRSSAWYNRKWGEPRRTYDVPEDQQCRLEDM